MTIEMQRRVLKRQNTCLRNRLRKLDRCIRWVAAGERVLRWSSRYFNHPTAWGLLQLRRATKQFEAATNR